MRYVDCGKKSFSFTILPIKTVIYAFHSVHYYRYFTLGFWVEFYDESVEFRFCPLILNYDQDSLARGVCKLSVLPVAKLLTLVGRDVIWIRISNIFLLSPLLKTTKWLDGWFCFNEIQSLGPGVEHRRQPQIQPRATKVWVGFWRCKMGYPLSLDVAEIDYHFSKDVYCNPESWTLM